MARLPSALHAQRTGLTGKGQRQMVLALINTVFAQDTADAASAQSRVVAHQLREKFPKLAAMMGEAENDVLAFMNFRKAHRKQLASINPLERLNAEIRRRTDVIGIFSETTPALCASSARCSSNRTMNLSFKRRCMQLEGMEVVSVNQTPRLSADITG